MRIVEPWPLQFVIDTVLVTSQTNTASINFQSPLGDEQWRSVIYAALLMIGVAMIRSYADYWRAILFSIVGNQIVTDLRAKVFQHVQNLSLDFHSRSRCGDLTVRMVGDINLLKDVMVSAALPLLASALVLAGMFGYMLYLNWQLGLLVLSTLPIFAVLAANRSHKIHGAATRQRKREGALAATTAESLTAVRSVQVHGISDRISLSFAQANRKSLKEGVLTSRLSAGLERTVDVLIALASALVLVQGTLFVIQGTLSAGGLVVYLTYVRRGFKPLQNFAKYTGRLSKAMAAASRISELLVQQPGVVDQPGAISCPTLRGKLEFQNVSFGYHDCPSVMNDYSFTIEPGQHVAIIGPSGIGKSTLLSLVLRLVDPTRGTIKVDGQDIQQWSLRSWRGQIAAVLQEETMFAASVRDNIAMGSPDAKMSDIEAAAQCGGAHEFILAFKEGYETWLGERGANISQGQCQRIAIARAALLNRPFLLLDEPTSNLDPQNRQLVISALRRVAKNRTTLLVTHDLQWASEMDRILLITGPNSFFFGTPQAVSQIEGAAQWLATAGAPVLDNAKPVCDVINC